jgi:hypothetical protein
MIEHLQDCDGKLTYVVARGYIFKAQTEIEYWKPKYM